MATIKQLADKAGVSTATVSRLLNENGFVSEDAKSSIQRAMEETGFDFENRRRRILSDKPSKSATRNMLMVWNIEPVHENTLTGQLMMQGITEALQPMDASLMVDHIYGIEKVPPSLKKGRLDGVFFHGESPSPAIQNELRKHPLVWLLKTGSFEFGDRVKPDHTLAGEISCDWLVQQGCRNLCCMNSALTESSFSNARTNFAHGRANGFLSRAEEMGVTCGLLVEANPSDPAQLRPDQTARAANLVEQFIHLDSRPDGLLVANEIGPYIHTELLKRGIVPMKDILLIAGDDTSWQNQEPKPVTIDIFSKEIGKEAVDLLLKRSNHPDKPQITCSLKPELIIPRAAAQPPANSR